MQGNISILGNLLAVQTQA